MEHIGIGVVGCGDMGLSMVRRVIALNPRLKVLAVFDPDQRAIDRTLSELPPTLAVCASFTTTAGK